MAKRKAQQTQNETKKLVKELTEKIKHERRNQVGTFEKDEGGLFKTKTVFAAKSMTKANYRQLFGLYKFMKEHPEMKEDEIRLLLHKKSLEFGFLIKCDRTIEDFFSELVKHGPASMAEEYEFQHGGLERFAKKHL